MKGTQLSNNTEVEIWRRDDLVRKMFVCKKEFLILYMTYTFVFIG